MSFREFLRGFRGFESIEGVSGTIKKFPENSGCVRAVPRSYQAFQSASGCYMGVNKTFNEATRPFNRFHEVSRGFSRV